MNYEINFCFLTSFGHEVFHRNFTVETPEHIENLKSYLINVVFEEAAYALRKWRVEEKHLDMTVYIEEAYAADGEVPEWISTAAKTLEDKLEEVWLAYK
jgi:hypothetical protein